jgi:hypothetical protein
MTFKISVMASVLFVPCDVVQSRSVHLIKDVTFSILKMSFSTTLLLCMHVLGILVLQFDLCH